MILSEKSHRSILVASIDLLVYQNQQNNFTCFLIFFLRTWHDTYLQSMWFFLSLYVLHTWFSTCIYVYFVCCVSLWLWLCIQFIDKEVAECVQFVGRRRRGRGWVQFVTDVAVFTLESRRGRYLRWNECRENTSRWKWERVESTWSESSRSVWWFCQWYDAIVNPFKYNITCHSMHKYTYTYIVIHIGLSIIKTDD